jgi:hypothetical protein
MIHVLQKDDGSENFHPGAEEDALRLLVLGQGNWGGYPVKGVNGVYANLDNPLVVPPSGQQWPGPTPAAAPLNDTRIQFIIEQVRYYHDTYGWDMSEGSTSSCPGGGSAGDCQEYLYNKYVVNTASNPGLQAAIPTGLEGQVIHIFMGEHPGVGTPTLDQYGVATNRYHFGGVAMLAPSRYVILRGITGRSIIIRSGRLAARTIMVTNRVPSKQRSITWRMSWATAWA